MKQITVKNPNNLPCIEHDKLTVLQGDLKTLSEENMGKLCHSIQKHGYFVPAFVWKSEGKHYILDATQRYHALSRMKEEGYEIPPIPYVEIEAEDKKDAAEKLLQITSRYGEINPNTSFFTDFDLKIDDIEIAIPEFILQNEKSFDGKAGKKSISFDVDFITNEEEALKVHHPEKFDGVENILIAFSGGKDSTFALLWAKKNFPDKHIKAFFSNTGVEFPGFCAHIDECCNFLDIEYKIAYPITDMWLQIHKQESWPSPMTPWCQNLFIYTPINKLYQEYNPENTIIIDGSAAKQSTRLTEKTKTSGVKQALVKDYAFYHPAFDVDREVIDSVLKKSGMPIWDGYEMGFVRTACWMCPNQCGDQAYALNQNYPGLVDAIRRWEKKIGKPLQTYNNRNIDDLIETGRKKNEKRNAV